MMPTDEYMNSFLERHQKIDSLFSLERLVMKKPKEITILPCGRIEENEEPIPIPIEELVSRLASTLNDKGDQTDFGLKLGDRDPWDLLDEIAASTKKNVSLVAGWCWWDSDIPNPDADRWTELRAKYQSKKLVWPPTLMKADNIIATNHYAFRPGDWVRTSPLSSFREGYLFETQNTVYALIGPGTRKTVDLIQARSFF